MQLDILKDIEKTIVNPHETFFDIFSIGKDNIAKLFNENKSRMLYVMMKST